MKSAFEDFVIIASQAKADFPWVSKKMKNKKKMSDRCFVICASNVNIASRRRT